jgi:hypothetical protein
MCIFPSQFKLVATIFSLNLKLEVECGKRNEKGGCWNQALKKTQIERMGEIESVKIIGIWMFISNHINVWNFRNIKKYMVQLGRLNMFFYKTIIHDLGFEVNWMVDLLSLKNITEGTTISNTQSNWLYVFMTE